MTQTIQQIPLTKLIASDANVRRTGRSNGIRELAASIEAHGLLQNLTVRRVVKGKTKAVLFEVVAGGRRLAALKSLVKTKAIRKDARIACHVLEDQIAEEISLAENQHEPMHPADEYEAFAKLHHEHGMSAEDIAARFGVTASVVKQRLKLGAVSPTLLSLYREGEMNLDQLTAFTMTDDHARQEQVWEALGFNNSRRSILRALTENQVAIDDRRVRFVGIEVYQAEGGTILRDLFDEDGGYLTDAVLLNRLVREKLQCVAEMVLAGGWKWVEVDPEFDYQRMSAMGRIETVAKSLSKDEQDKLAGLQQQLEVLSEAAEQNDPSEAELAEIDRLEAEITALTEETFVLEDVARAGAVVSLGHDGEYRIERGFIRPEDEIGKGKFGDEEGAVEGTATARSAGMSAALVADLTAHRTAALRNDLAQAPELALIAVAHVLAVRFFFPHEGDISCLNITARELVLSSFAEGIGESIAAQAIEARHRTWKERLPQTVGSLWPFIASMSMDDLLALLAHCASLTLDTVERTAFPTGHPTHVHAAALAQAMPHGMSRYWQPTGANYLGRVSKELIVEAVRDGVGEDAAQQISGLKKQAMALRAEELLAGKDWLPPLLRPVAQDAAQLAA